MASPNGVAISLRVEYGLTLAYEIANVTAGCPSLVALCQTSLDLGELAPDTVYYFRAAAAYSGGTVYGGEGSFKTCPLAGCFVFTDDPLVPGVTLVKRVHITELRDAINQLRIANNLLAFQWSESITTQSTVAKAQHIIEARTALEEVYTRPVLTVPPHPPYTDPQLSAGMPIKGVHILELRAFIKAIE
jgi:hypothetical protein